MSAIVTPETANQVAAHLDATDDLPIAEGDQVDGNVADADANVHLDVHLDVGGDVEGNIAGNKTGNQLPQTTADSVDHPSPQVPGENGEVAPQQPLDAEADRQQRFDAMLEQLVPKIEMRSKVKQPPTDFFDADELPFQEKTLLWHYPDGWRAVWGLTDSLLLPYILSILTILASTFTLFTYITTFTKSAVENVEGFSDLVAIVVIMAAPLFVALRSTRPLLEHPSKLVLYYRLWEQKIVINFKQRGLTDKSTIGHLAVLGFTLVGYIVYCLISAFITDKWSFFVVVAQSLGTIALTIYTNVSLEARLQGFNPALRHYQAAKDPEKDGVTSNHNSEKARKAIEQVKFIEEKCVKYDIAALRCYDAKVLLPKLKKAKEENKQMPTLATSAAIAACEEERRWLKVLAMWIGRLGNNKDIAQARWGVSRVHEYAKGFVTDDDLYSDAKWHEAGSFKHHHPRRTGSLFLLRSGEIAISLAVLAIELYGIYRAIMRNELFSSSSSGSQ